MSRIGPAWERRFQQSSLVIVGALIGTVLGASLDIADKAFKVSDKLGLTKSEALVLAQESDKSRFSDAFTRSAYRRLILADIFARRVQDEAPMASIDEAWKVYVGALIDWNSDLMINIVGLETFYGAQKSVEFENVIQDMFRRLDDAMRRVYLSPALSSLRSHPEQTSSLVGLRDSAKDISDKTENIRLSLYVFVRCFNQGKSKETSTGCDVRELRPGSTP